MGSAAMSFHQSLDESMQSNAALTYLAGKWQTYTERGLGYQFESFFHPYAHELMKRLQAGSVTGLEDADTATPALARDLFTPSAYAPTTLVTGKPAADLDFRSRGAYSVYNWELFFHLPLAVAIHLSRNQKFADSQRWFHYVFDPTDDSAGPTPQRFWKVKPFQTTDVELIEQILVNLATGADAELKAETISCIEAWRVNPFRPFLIARYRPTAYMFKAVMAYLDNLIDWGDWLFRQDSGEAINEATQLYVLAADILGRRPQVVPRKGFNTPQTYSTLRKNLDALSNAAIGLEGDISLDQSPHPGASDEDQLATLRGLGATLYFCTPRNDKLMSYWDTVADRLFKIRNSLNIEGIFRQLPLFDPPIDPALLARAAAAGLDISAVVAGVNQPLPLIRFSALLAKAFEVAQEVKSLGAGLLSALEKEDGERLGVLRAQHELGTLQLAESVRYQQVQEAGKNRQALERSLSGAVNRYRYFELLLGRKDSEITIPSLDELDLNALASMTYAQTEPSLDDKLRAIDPDIAEDLSNDGEGRILNRKEMEELSKLASAHVYEVIAAGLAGTGAGLSALPFFEASAKPFGVGAGVKLGGLTFGLLFNLAADVVKIGAQQYTYEANKAGKLGAFDRRQLDWSHQSNVAAAEISQTFVQLRAAQLREAIAQRELDNHRQQIRNAEAIETFLTDDRTGKTTNTEFYTWLKRELRTIHNQAYQVAFDVARRAERALQHELGTPDQTFLQFSYNSGKEGLLSGEKLWLDLKRMELAYHDLNRREYELTKHVSMRQLDPVALLTLRKTGSATITIPEGAFDLDAPGQYFRRIKSVGVTIPCVIGPYASVSCTLTLLKSSIRKSPLLGDNGYPRAGDDTERFSDFFGSLDAIVTSTAQNDSGMFETNLRDERYLPFEGAGAISQWQLTLPLDVPQFDPETIADVILHVRYTAREGGAQLRTSAVGELKNAIATAAALGSVRLLSVRHDFPTEWAQFTAAAKNAGGTFPLRFTLRPEHYPYWSRIIKPADLALRDLAVLRSDLKPLTWYDSADRSAAGTIPPAVGDVTRYLEDNTMTDIWLALTWGDQSA
jgi:hypothetical protein